MAVDTKRKRGCKAAAVKRFRNSGSRLQWEGRERAIVIRSRAIIIIMHARSTLLLYEMTVA